MVVILLENLRSSFNVGSIFRTADAVGVKEIALVGYTPRPIDRFGRICHRLQKTALGSESSVPWKGFSTTKEALSYYENHIPVAVEYTQQAVPYTKCQIKNPLFLFGNETQGLGKDTLSSVSTHVFLPMQGTKQSLNVSVCASVILYHTFSLSSQNSSSL